MLDCSALRPLPLPSSQRRWRAGMLTQAAWPCPVVLSPFKRPTEPCSLGRFVPFEPESTGLKKGTSRHLSFSPTLRKDCDLLELKELIELSFRAKSRQKQPQNPLPVAFPPQKPAETKEKRESLSDTIDSQVLNIELHYQENLNRAGKALTAPKPAARGCPLQAVRSFGGKKPLRSPLPLHGVVLGGPGKVWRGEKSLEMPKQTVRRRPSSFYRLRLHRYIPQAANNSDCLHISRIHCIPPPLTCTESSRLDPLALKSTESDDSDSFAISRPNLTVQ